MNNKFTRILVIFILGLPVIVLLVNICHYGVNIVYWDDWSLAALYDDIISNGFSFSKLYGQHNEHRIFFPRIIMLASLYLTKWNTKSEMYISVCILTVTYFMIVKHVTGKKTADLAGSDVVFPALLGLCFMSACQWQNMLWGFQVAWFLVEMSVVCSVAFFSAYLVKRSIIYWIMAVIFATIATYSSLQGLAVWPMYASLYLIISLSARKFREWSKWVLLGIVGMAEIVFYFYHYVNVSYHEQYKSTGISECCRFMMKQLGYIFSDSNEMLAEFYGIMLSFLAVLLILYLIYKKKAEEYMIPLGMIIFGLGVILMISIGRANLQLASRYTTYALMVLIGELCILYGEMNKKQKTVKLTTGFSQIFVVIEVILITLCLTESLDSIQIWKEIRTERLMMKDSLQNYSDVSLELLQKIYPWQDYEQAYEAIGLLAEKEWSVWADH